VAELIPRHTLEPTRIFKEALMGQVRWSTDIRSFGGGSGGISWINVPADGENSNAESCSRRTGTESYGRIIYKKEDDICFQSIIALYHRNIILHEHGGSPSGTCETNLDNNLTSREMWDA
jgi:hypothetical protein